MTEQTLNRIQVKILDKRLGTSWPLPQYQTPGSAAMDLLACIEETTVIKPKECILIPTGISIFINHSHYCAKILPRSGLGHKHGIVLGNGTGLIDADYQGPLMISCLNRSCDDYPIAPGDRIAQLIFIPIVKPALCVVDEFDENASERGEGGFGSTGQ